MRRSDREIHDIAEIEQIIDKADVCRLGLSDDNVPYIVAMNFGYCRDGNPVFYFHCAGEGRKIEMIRRNNRVCFQLDTDHELVRADAACGWGMNYRSVMGTGRAGFVEEKSEKITAMNAIMKHYSDRDDHEYSEEQLAVTTIIKLTVTEMTGKKKGYRNSGS